MRPKRSTAAFAAASTAAGLTRSVGQVHAAGVFGAVGRVELVALAVEQHELRIAGRECGGERAAEVAARAGDDDDAVQAWRSFR